MRSADERNRAAGKALELFYQLAEAEAGRDALKRSLDHAEQSIANLRELKDRGLAVGVDDSELETQKSDLLTRQTELELSIEKLNGGLYLLLGNERSGQPPIWPEADLTVTAEPIDEDEAVAVGLGTRADLAMLRYLLATLDEDTLPTVRSSLRQQEFSLGNPPAPMRGLLRIFKRDDSSSELEIRRYQLMRLMADQERTASEEIRSAVATVNTRVRQVAVANQSLETRRQRLKDVRAKQRIGRATALNVSKAQADVIEAEYTLVQKAGAWRVAQTKLHEAQGLLAVDCGYGPAGHSGMGFPCPECLAPQGSVEFVNRPIHTNSMRTYPKRTTRISTRDTSSNTSPSVSLNADSNAG